MSHQIIKVRGYAETPVESDMAKWGITVKARNRNMVDAYTVLAEHRRGLRFSTGEPSRN